MPNPFTRYTNPQTPAERQSNANHAFFELMGAQEALNACDRDGIRADRETIADFHTARWVHREYDRLARNAR